MANLVTFRTNLQVDLGTSANTEFSDTEIDRAVQKAVDDLSRVYPKRLIKEVTNNFQVTDESFTTDGTAGVYVSLANNYIKPATEVVTSDPAGTTYTRDTDYTIDYLDGRITHISGGAMGNSTAFLITYLKMQTVIDVSDISGSMLRVDKVEFPGGQVPEHNIDFRTWGDYLIVTSSYPSSQDDTPSQARMGDFTHIWIFYESVQDAPIAAANGSYPTILDEVIYKGAAMYLCYGIAAKQLYLVNSVTDDAETALDNAAIDTHLD